MPTGARADFGQVGECGGRRRVARRRAAARGDQDGAGDGAAAVGGRQQTVRLPPRHVRRQPGGQRLLRPRHRPRPQGRPTHLPTDRRRRYAARVVSCRVVSCRVPCVFSDVCVLGVLWCAHTAYLEYDLLQNINNMHDSSRQKFDENPEKILAITLRLLNAVTWDHNSQFTKLWCDLPPRCCACARSVLTRRAVCAVVSRVRWCVCDSQGPTCWQCSTSTRSTRSGAV
jgi:hypothetical protein